MFIEEWKHSWEKGPEESGESKKMNVGCSERNNEFWYTFDSPSCPCKFVEVILKKNRAEW